MDADLKLAAPAPDRNEGALGPYLRAVAAHRLLVFSTTLLAVLGAVAWLALRSPDYEATAELLVTPLPQDDRSFFGLDLFRDSGDPTRTVQTAATVLRTPEAAEEAARKLGGDFTRSRVLESVEVEPRGQSSVLAVRGRDPDPETAARIADEYAAGILEVRRRRLSDQVDKRIELLEARDRGLNESSRNDELKADIAEQLNALESIRGGDDPTLSLSQTAGVPGSPVGAPPWLIAALALLAGFTLGSGAALLMELLGRRLRDEDEIVRLYPLPILARIPNAARQMRKIADASPLALPPAVREAFRTLRVQLDQRTEAQGTIMITSASTGDGKTTSAVNLAVALVGAGHQVILIDFDLRKPDVGRALGVSPTRGLVSLLASDTRLSDLIVKAPPLPPLGVVPAGTEGDAFLLEALSKRLPEILAEARALADYVVLDTPPLGEVSDALRLAGHVDDIVVVARPGQTNRASFELMRDLLGRSGRVPAGLVLIGKSSGAPSSYYTYGMPQRDPVAARLPFARSS